MPLGDALLLFVPIQHVTRSVVLSEHNRYTLNKNFSGDTPSKVGARAWADSSHR
jgi:hypothetical protein